MAASKKDMTSYINRVCKETDPRDYTKRSSRGRLNTGRFLQVVKGVVEKFGVIYHDAFWQADVGIPSLSGYRPGLRRRGIESKTVEEALRYAFEIPESTSVTVENPDGVDKARGTNTRLFYIDEGILKDFMKENFSPANVKLTYKMSKPN